jgi:S-adenosylmethionine:tRNA ribosyltransferase-isomerase
VCRRPPEPQNPVAQPQPLHLPADSLLSAYEYELPPELIAQQPLERRGGSRLLHLPADGAPRHLLFSDLPEALRQGDLLVVNDTRVLPARIRFRIGEQDAEILLLHPTGKDSDTWECLVRPGRRAYPGARLQLQFALWADVLEKLTGGGRVLRFSPPGRLPAVLPEIGEAPLPPYIRERLDDPERYQTVYARVPGSAAAPTAGLHFDKAMLERLQAAGVERSALTLRIGLDTFQPLRNERLDQHRMHSEAYEIPASTRAAIDACRRRRGRVVAVGTTTARALEAAALKKVEGHPDPDVGSTDIFIRPGFNFREVDLLLTNFHLPRSTLLVMVSSLAGRERVMGAYQEAIQRRYRFYSFGDAMLVEPA